MKLLIAVLFLSQVINCFSFAEKCDGVDLVFVVDSSNSIWPPNYNLYIKPFIKDLVNFFNIGPGSKDSRIGVVTFSNNHQLQFNLNTHFSHVDIENAVDNMKLSHGDTYTYKALKYATEVMFTSENGDRTDVQNVMIILTDGASNNATLTKAAAAEAKLKGIRVFAIGVGKKVNFQELQDMASVPSETYVFRITDYRFLADIKRNFGDKDCRVLTTSAPATITTPTSTYQSPSTTTSKPSTTTTRPTTTTQVTTTTTKKTTTTQEPTTTTTRLTTTTREPTTPRPTTTTQAPTTTTQTPTSTTTIRRTTRQTTISQTPTTTVGFQDEDRNITYCDGKPADIFFILDSSNSVYKDDFHDKTLSFVRDVVSTFNIGPNKTRVGMVTFSDIVEFNFGLKAHQDKQSLLNAIQPEHIRYLGGQTQTGDAIKFVRMNGYQVGGSARPGAARIIIVITDGISQDPDYTKKEAQAARDIGAYIFAIGVGTSVDKIELNDIASNPDEDYVFTVNNYGALKTIRNLIPRKVCDADTTTPTPLDPTRAPAYTKCPSTHVHFIYESGTKSVAERATVVDVMWRFSNDRSNQVLPIKVGVTTDACTSSKKIPFSDIEQFRQTLNTLQSTQKVTTYSLVRRVRRQYGNIPEEIAKLMVVFVDESSIKDIGRLNAEIRYAKYKGFKVMIIAIGTVSGEYLRGIVSQPEESFFYHVNSYEELKYVNIRASHLVCENGQEIKTTGLPTTTRRRPLIIPSRRPS